MCIVKTFHRQRAGVNTKVINTNHTTRLSSYFQYNHWGEKTVGITFTACGKPRLRELNWWLLRVVSNGIALEKVTVNCAQTKRDLAKKCLNFQLIKVSTGVLCPIELQFCLIIPRWAFNCGVALYDSVCNLVSVIPSRKSTKFCTWLEILSPINHM